MFTSSQEVFAATFDIVKHGRLVNGNERVCAAICQADVSVHGGEMRANERGENTLALYCQVDGNGGHVFAPSLGEGEEGFFVVVFGISEPGRGKNNRGLKNKIFCQLVLQ